MSKRSRSPDAGLREASAGTCPYRGRTALVTGGLGFVGRALSRALVDAGARVAIVDTFADRAGNSSRRRITVYSTDIRDTPALCRVVELENPDTVFHLAARHFLPDCEANPAACLSVNVDGTASVLAAVTDSPTLKRIVFASSGAVYKPSAVPHREDAELQPIDTYGTSKLLAERAVAQFSQWRDVAVYVARLFNVYGPGETNPHLVPAVFQQALAADVLHLGNLATERDYVFLHDVVDALLRLGLVSGPRGTTTVNVGTGSGLTGAAMVDAIAAVLGRSLFVRTASSRMRSTDRPRLVADADYAWRLVGWRARTRLNTGLRQSATHPVAVDRTHLQLDAAAGRTNPATGGHPAG